jgi:hypothetical protein
MLKKFEDIIVVDDTQGLNSFAWYQILYQMNTLIIHPLISMIMYNGIVCRYSADVAEGMESNLEETYDVLPNAGNCGCGSELGHDFVSDDVDRLVFQDESVNPNMCCHKRMDLNMVYQSRPLLNGQRSEFIV